MHGRTPTWRSNALLNTSALLKPSEVAILSTLFRGISTRRRASLIRASVTNCEGALPKALLNKRVKFRRDMPALSARESTERLWLRWDRIQAGRSAKRSDDWT